MLHLAEHQQVVEHSGPKEKINMATALAALPCKVIWSLSNNEMPMLKLGNNTKVKYYPHSCLWRDRLMSRVVKVRACNVIASRSSLCSGAQLGPAK